MLTRLVDWSLAHRVIVILLWVGIAVAGVLSALSLPLDAFPDTTPVQVQVNTVAPALGPLEIERRITTPIEWAISGLPSIHEVRSVSKTGFSQITVTFDDGVDIYRARQFVSERLGAVALPEGTARPSLGPVATGLGEVFHYIVQGHGPSLASVRATQQWIIAPQLRSVPGVAEINTWGGDERQVQVVVDPAVLRRFDLTLDELATALEANNASAGGGTMDRGGESSLIQGVGIATSLEDIAAMVVATREGVPVRVRDLAQVIDGREIRRGALTADGRGEAVLGLGFMLIGENSRDVTQRLRIRLDEVRRTLPRGVTAEVVYDRTTLVDHVLRTVRNNLFEGALLVIAILLAFLGNLRAGLIVALAIPLSMLVASTLMLRVGIAGSLMSLGAIDFGLLVDSSVIQVENVIRRASEDPEGRTWLQVVRDAVVEVREPTLFGELIIAIVYLPILTLEGMEGKLFRPMAWTVIFALAGSMLLSLTLLPVLSSYGLSFRSAHGDNVLVRLLKRGYSPVLRAALRRPWVVLGLSALIFTNVAFLATRIGTAFIPRLGEGTIVINKVQLAGVSAEESARYSTQIERALLRKFPHEIERVWTRTGTAEVATDPMGLELADMFLTLKPPDGWRRAHTQEDLVAEIAEELEAFPGARFIFTQPIEMRVNEMIAGIRADLGVRLFGDDIEVLRQKAREIEAAIRTVSGAVDVSTEQVVGQPVVRIDVDREAVARQGIPVSEVLSSVESLGTREVGVLYDGARRYPIALRIDDAYRTDETALGSMLITASNGDRIPLSRLAHIETTEGPSTVNHEWGRRRIVVQANVRGRDLGSFVGAVREAMDRDVDLPDGYYVRFGGQFEHMQRARDRLAIVVPVALVLIFTLLMFTYRRWQDALRVFTGVPFAAAGGVAALWLREMPFTVSAGIGFVVLSGVAVLGDMVLVSTIRQRLASGMELGAAIVDAAETRLRPVLMTSLVAGFGFIPMAMSTDFGSEVQRPLATVVIGGLITSTLLTLLVLPVLYRVVGAPSAGAAREPSAS